VVYHAIYAEGEHELQRNSLELGLSGLAAGLSMGFSLVGEGLLKANLPGVRWATLIAKFGYSLGFLIVFLGRQQLFTKNTLTVILPLLREKKPDILLNVARLWAVVLLANLVGAFVFAWIAADSNLFSPDVLNAFSIIGQKSFAPGFSILVLRGAVAGWLIALIVWLLPFAESGRVWVIIFLAYVVGLADLPHVIAGSVEVFYLACSGSQTFWNCIGHYIVPTFIGNVIGGVALVAFGAHAEFFEAEEATKT
jgi:formate/nitrite transporter FocA (FNT family)